ncbi:F-box protein [Trifolium medium]|uniref:F-box protein n=1 Tax=Trifolium medium TaxID=97028 RepID=A0A392M6L2_9FABA|nr:F-box protein [Trifolium medium]
MEESLTVTNLQVSNHIPDDIVLYILSKLPLKSFKRFECVRKSWSLLFDDPYFITIYRNYFLSKDSSCYDHTCLLVGVKEGTEYYSRMGGVLVDDLYSLSGENFENSVKLDWPKPFPENEYLVPNEHYSGFGILGSASVNGILCLCAFHDTEWKLILWNSTTTEFKVIPSSPFELGEDATPHRHLLGYDRIEDDYKVIRFIECDVVYDEYGDANDDDGFVSFWEIYSLNDNLWGKIDDHISLFSDNKDVYMDGVSHWWHKSETHTYLVSFDFSDESFTTTPIPFYIDDSFPVLRKDLLILNGSIAFIINYKKTSTIHILILGELGVKESWTKLLVVGPSPCLNYPIVVAKKGKILFRNRDRNQYKQGLVWFDLSTGMIDMIDLTTQISGRVSSRILFHKESILPIGGICN